ncbi:MAG TPA: TIGR03905 family TSCPD domain-containing protein [Ruminococcaceae bacterium]|nr:TIGR03905 family TSCPD domain-containing protein [Oscillospiraceae bacterium]
MIIEYTPKGVCSRKMTIEVEEGIIKDVKVIGGCNGNLKGISSLVKGMTVDEVIKRLDGIDCNGKGTSCPAQLANALKEYKERA